MFLKHRSVGVLSAEQGVMLTLWTTTRDWRLGSPEVLTPPRERAVRLHFRRHSQLDKLMNFFSNLFI